jgi:hypothetical protein
VADIAVELSVAIIAVTGDSPRVLLVQNPSSGRAALPSGRFEPERDRTLELAVRRWVREQAQLELGYVEQLYTFGDRDRDPRERMGGARILSIGYLALVGQAPVDERDASAWRDWYDFFPWEDWRRGRPAVLDRTIGPLLRAWTQAAATPAERRLRRERTATAFGRGGTWIDETVLERYELLYEAQLVPEALDARPASRAEAALGDAMALDHRRILATAMGRLRGKIKYRPVVFELLPSRFTLSQLQRSVEALAGARLHTANFRRVVELGGLVEASGRRVTGTGGRPAAEFRFRHEVLLERPAPGLRVGSRGR